LIFWAIACTPAVNCELPGKASTDCCNVHVSFMSKEPILIGSGGTFSAGIAGCTGACPAG